MLAVKFHRMRTTLVILIQSRPLVDAAVQRYLELLISAVHCFLKNKVRDFFLPEILALWQE